MRPQRQRASLDHLAKYGFIVQQRAAHAEPLRALPGKNKSQSLVGAESFATGRETGASLSFKESLETFDKLLRRIADYTHAIVVMTAARARAVTDVVQRQLSARQKFQEDSRDGLQSLRTARREWQKVTGLTR